MAIRDINTARHAAERPLSEVIRERRATPHFAPTPVDEHDLKNMLELALQAPSGYNLQPWRFVVVRDAEVRRRLQEAAMGQPKVGEAPVVVVACGDQEGWKNYVEDMLNLGHEHGFSSSNDDQARKNITGLLGGGSGTAAGIDASRHVWVNRHVMIAFTTLMWAAESLGYDTAPMEGFFEDKVREVLGIPSSVRVVALLAIGHRKGDDKKYGGRFPVERLVFADRWDKPLKL